MHSKCRLQNVAHIAEASLNILLLITLMFELSKQIRNLLNNSCRKSIKPALSSADWPHKCGITGIEPKPTSSALFVMKQEFYRMALQIISNT